MMKSSKPPEGMRKKGPKQRYRKCTVLRADMSSGYRKDKDVLAVE